MIQVAIQGFKASFHDVAARTWFENQELALIECASFKALALSLEGRKADLAVMAIENTIAGSILPNYGLLETYGFKIIGETYLRIEHSLMALPSVASTRETRRSPRRSPRHLRAQWRESHKDSIRADLRAPLSVLVSPRSRVGQARRL